jgi:hypothetical protein
MGGSGDSLCIGDLARVGLIGEEFGLIEESMIIWEVFIRIRNV